VLLNILAGYGADIETGGAGSFKVFRTTRRSKTFNTTSAPGGVTHVRDPIVEEVRRARAAYAAQFDNDLDRIVDDLKRR
jgi:hypothetical protein